MRTTVYLHGRLKDRFGGPFSLEIETGQEAFRALAANLKGFLQELRIGAYKVISGPKKKGRELDIDTLGMGLSEGKPLHIIPVTAGSKRGGVGKLIMGVALVAVAAVATGGFALGAGATAFGMGSTGWASVAMFGASFAFAGVSQMLTPTPKGPDMNNLERPDQRASFMMSGAVNVSSQGQPVPIIGGRVRAGSVVASMGLSTEQIAVPA